MSSHSEEYDAELEQMNQSMAAENQALAHDNKQLSGLIKEYESTLDTLMSACRACSLMHPLISFFYSELQK